MSKKVWNN